MDDVALVRSEEENLRKIQTKLLQWDSKDNPLAPLTNAQQDALNLFTQLISEGTTQDKDEARVKECEDYQVGAADASSKSLKELYSSPNGINSIHEFLVWFNKVNEDIHDNSDEVYRKYLDELELRSSECDKILEEVRATVEKLADLENEYDFVSKKTNSLNVTSKKLTQAQTQLINIREEIQKRMHYFTQAEHLARRLQSPTVSVASDNFREYLNTVDECLDYLKQNPSFKESSLFAVKYKHCLSRAITLMKNYVINVLSQATGTIRSPKEKDEKTDSDAAFALYYGKFQASAVKVKKISAIIEERVEKSSEYEQLLLELHNCYLSERAVIMSPAVDKAIKALESNNKGDNCSLVRSACTFLVHVCQDEHRLFFQFFTMPSEQLNTYLEGLCTILYDSLRPHIIHINHLETLVEICSILRMEMLEEHVQQNPNSLQSFGKVAFQLLQDVQERLVFRAHLYLQSDILNYNPCGADLAYPEKLEMMESIALSLQEQSSAGVLSATPESMAENVIRSRSTNSPADLHGMWYPTVRRTLACLSRLYRCVDKSIFQGLSQEALQYCIQSVSNAAAKITATKSPIDGELFEIKHLLILREQIAPFRVDFTVKETSLDFSKVKTAAFTLLQKRKQLFSLESNNALLEFLLEGTPQIKEQLLDSRKDVDRQLKFVCEQFIKDSTRMLVGPILEFLEKAQTLLAESKPVGGKERSEVLRLSPWASPQQIRSYIQESQRLIKNKLAYLQRSMQLYLSNRDTEFIIFRPIRNNIISAVVKLEQLLSSNGYTQDDIVIAGCPSAEQISILLSSASVLASNTSTGAHPICGKVSTSSADNIPPVRKISEDKKVSFHETVSEVKDVKDNS